MLLLRMPREQCVLRGGVEGALPSYVLPFVPVKRVKLLGGDVEGALRTFVLVKQVK